MHGMWWPFAITIIIIMVVMVIAIMVTMRMIITLSINLQRLCHNVLDGRSS